MANLARFPKSPRCLFCFGRINSYDISDFILPFHRQLRGKKKRSKLPHVLNVKLLTNIPGFGREGSVVPMAPGRMRNLYYPRQQAAYLSREELHALKAQDTPIERDFTFMVKKKPKDEKTSDESAIQESEEDTTKLVQIDLLSPQGATKILSSLPDILPFYRTPITISEPERPQRPSRLVVSPSLANPAPLESLSEAPVETIYGSVSVADIADEVKAILGRTEEGARVVVGAEDITIVGKEGGEETEEADRLKVLGDFEVDIRVKGGDAVRRIVRISAEESS